MEKDSAWELWVTTWSGDVGRLLRTVFAAVETQRYSVGASRLAVSERVAKYH
jgi:hypothetical protein